MRAADVYFGDRKAGRLEETATGFRFSYGGDYLGDTQARPVSLGLPLRQEPYESESLFSFFDGMIPEGWYLDIVCKTLKVDPDDRFGLLIANASQAIGAVTVRPSENADGS